MRNVVKNQLRAISVVDAGGQLLWSAPAAGGPVSLRLTSGSELDPIGARPDGFCDPSKHNFLMVEGSDAAHKSCWAGQILIPLRGAGGRRVDLGGVERPWRL